MRSMSYAGFSFWPATPRALHQVFIMKHHLRCEVIKQPSHVRLYSLLHLSLLRTSLFPIVRWFSSKKLTALLRNPLIWQHTSAPLPPSVLNHSHVDTHVHTRAAERTPDSGGKEKKKVKYHQVKKNLNNAWIISEMNNANSFQESQPVGQELL